MKLFLTKLKVQFFGQAIGDAIGFHTEFLSLEDAQKLYKGTVFTYDTIQENRNFSIHPIYGRTARWTDDTDQMLMILDDVLHNSGDVDVFDFAKRMKWWTVFGLTQLGDYRSFDVGFNTRSVLKKVFLETNSSPNGASMRTSVLGIVAFHDVNRVIDNSIKIASATHGSPLSIAASVTTSVLIALLLQKIDIDKAINQAELIGKEVLRNGGTPIDKRLFESFLHANSIDELELNVKKGFAMKPIGCAVYFLRNRTPFETAINTITMCAGDADTNGAVVGAVLGSYYGFDQIPQRWIDIPYKDWLMNKIESLVKLMDIALE
ncbi:ADP-ribosylglycohydrolase [Entamoeba marina]